MTPLAHAIILSDTHGLHMYVSYQPVALTMRSFTINLISVPTYSLIKLGRYLWGDASRGGSFFLNFNIFILVVFG